MKIFLHEITDLETELTFTQEEPWVVQAVLKVDEHLENLPSTAQSRPILAEFSLRKVDEVIVISGKIQTYIEQVCSRCANLFHFKCSPAFSALFCKDPVMAGVGHLSSNPVGGNCNPVRPSGQNSGFARHAHNFEEDDAVSGGKDLDITYLSHDFIDLSDVISEQLQLQVPFQPLCEESCKGICHHCGADLNQGRCACAKIKSNTPFSVLSDFKF